MTRSTVFGWGLLTAAILTAAPAAAQYPYTFPYTNASQQAANVGAGLPWHNQYYHQAYGEPLSLVVPPTAEYQTHYAWDVAGMRNTPIFHQFGRRYPGGGQYGGGFRHPPYWPSDTNQFGVHYVRGPW